MTGKRRRRAPLVGAIALALVGLAYAPVGAQRLMAQASQSDLTQALVTYRQALSGLADASWTDQEARFAALADRLAGTPWALRAEAARLDCLARQGATDRLSHRGRAILAESERPDWFLYAVGHALEGTDREAAEQAYARLLSDQPKSVLTTDTLMALGALTIERDPAVGAHYLRRITEHHADDPLAERAVYLLATKGPVADRAGWLRAYRERFPDGKHLSPVNHALARVTDLSPPERLALAGDLLTEGEFGLAARLLKALNSPLALFRAGRAAWRLGDDKQAIALLKRSMALDPKLRARVYLTFGQMEEKHKHVPQAAAAYRQAASGRVDEALEALQKLGALYRKVDDDPHAEAIDREVLARFPDNEAATEAQWRFLWRAHRARDYDGAEVWARRLGSAILVKVEGPGGEYWLGRLRERKGDVTGALAAYREVMHLKPRSYYGWRARFRIEALTAHTAPQGFPVRPVDARVPCLDTACLIDPAHAATGRDAGYLHAVAKFPASLRELTNLGLVDPVERYARRHDADPDLQAWLALAGGQYPRAISLSSGSDPYLSYPLAYYPFVQAASGLQGLDPLLLTALVKQESNFEPTSRSWVGAVGLAQLMPFTADWVGRKVPGPARSLTDPFWNLKLGAYYLTWVERQLDNQPMLAVAAYNAGPHAVRKWLSANPTDDWEAWVELIPYPETRHYVKKVFGNLWTYEELYGGR
jgi:soluble lytic murein transglycosylase